MTTVDIFEGGGGWPEAFSALGMPGGVGVELNPDACATAEAAGHHVIQADVAELDPRIFSDAAGLVGSPPCPSFSTAGKGLGKLDVVRILAHIAAVRATGRWIDYSREGWADPRSMLVLEPLRYALLCRPGWIALEQVPPVLPIWLAIAEVLRDHGYHVECGLLTAEQYGVPQTRKRAILAARRCLTWCPRQPSVCVRSRNLLPAPTHRKYRKGVDRAAGDPGLLPWVSMADALDIHLEGDWLLRSNYGTGGDPANRGTRTLDEPAPTVTGKIDRNKWVMRASVSDQGTDKSRNRSLEEPAQTITSKHRSAAWIFDRPAPTIVGTRRSSEGMLLGRQLPPGERQDVGGASGGPGLTPDQLPAVRVTVREAAVLQSFRADYPWQGSPTKQYLQVGNAIPPLLAVAVVGQLTFAEGWREVCAGMFAPNAREQIVAIAPDARPVTEGGRPARSDGMPAA